MLTLVFVYRPMLTSMAPTRSTLYRRRMAWHMECSFSAAMQLVPSYLFLYTHIHTSHFSCRINISNTWECLLLLNIYPNVSVEVMLQPTPALTWVAIGGILDLYVFMGPDPQSVTRQYLQVIGTSLHSFYLRHFQVSKAINKWTWQEKDM